DKGLSKEEGLEICRRLIATGWVDFLNVIRGHIEHDGPLSRIMPVTGMPSAPHLDFAGEVRAATKFPVFHAARINDVATARHAIAEGKLDMVGMTRAHITDPHIVRKITEGREADIRPCVGATYCLDRIYEGNEALCIHNAATGREATMPHVIVPSSRAKQSVVVVGAGPGGLEAARVCAERGHRVVLLEAANQPGGQIRLAVQVKRRKEMIGIVDWRVRQCERLKVDIRFNAYAEASDVLALEPDIVVVATGGLPTKQALEEGEELAVTGWDILSGDAKPASDVLLFDDNGADAGLAAAEFVAESGAQLELVSPERYFSPDIGLSFVPYMKIFEARGVKITTMMRVRALRRMGNKIAATLWSPYAERDTGERLVDQVIVENATLPAAELYFDLKPRSSNKGRIDYDALLAGVPQPDTGTGFRLYRIGDA
ncbi:MAG: FAD-dependent oxidoreductase, partial [Aestuariivirgaceae bacterium]